MSQKFRQLGDVRRDPLCFMAGPGPVETLSRHAVCFTVST